MKIFKALSDRNRLRTFSILLKAETPLCVCEMMDILGVSQYNVSRYVRELKNAGLLEETRDGKWVYYGVKNRFGTTISSIEEMISTIPEDELRCYMSLLKMRLSLRDKGRCTVGLDSEEWMELEKTRLERKS